MLQEYFHGLSTETLSDLLGYVDKYIRELTLWIISELGETTAEEIEEQKDFQSSIADYRKIAIAKLL